MMLNYKVGTTWWIVQVGGGCDILACPTMYGNTAFARKWCVHDQAAGECRRMCFCSCFTFHLRRVYLRVQRFHGPCEYVTGTLFTGPCLPVPQAPEYFGLGALEYPRVPGSFVSRYSRAPATRCIWRLFTLGYPRYSSIWRPAT